MATFPPFVFVQDLRLANHEFAFSASLEYPNPGSPQLNQADFRLTTVMPNGIGLQLGKQFAVDDTDWVTTIKNIAADLEDAVEGIEIPEQYKGGDKGTCLN